jgi:alkanesulfonate monooxygenase SsuD/methylene tetrahydromethanopterin reductase-like flavin-dependent oxidoreductase (luciferase family)
VRFGVYLPTFAGPDLDVGQAAQVETFARRAGELGFDALWVAEHFLEAPGLYGAVWMSPLLCLGHAASATTRIRLATGLLILPYYHPVTLAREIQNLWHLSDGRSCSVWPPAGTSTSSRPSA